MWVVVDANAIEPIPPLEWKGWQYWRQSLALKKLFGFFILLRVEIKPNVRQIRHLIDCRHWIQLAFLKNVDLVIRLIFCELILSNSLLKENLIDVLPFVMALLLGDGFNLVLHSLIKSHLVGLDRVFATSIVPQRNHPVWELNLAFGLVLVSTLTRRKFWLHLILRSELISRLLNRTKHE